MRHHHILTRRDLLQSTFATALWPFMTFAGQQQSGRALSPNLALRLSQSINRTGFGDLPPRAIEHAKMILASTLASAAAGSRIDSARIVCDLAKERGGKAEATIWFDGSKLPVSEVAR